MMHLYSALCIVVYPKRYTIMWGVSPQPPPVCSIHLDDATAATGQLRQCAHHTPATGGEERESLSQSSVHFVFQTLECYIQLAAMTCCIINNITM